MKKVIVSIGIVLILVILSCEKDELSERFKLLITPTWVSDSLLANGVEASGPGEILEKFKGEAKFNSDGTGEFGVYTGTWQLTFNETQIVISSDSLDLPVTAQIVELTANSLKIVTSAPESMNSKKALINIRMTFTSK